MVDDLRSIKKIFNIISLIELRARASFISVYYINLTLINEWIIKE